MDELLNTIIDLAARSDQEGFKSLMPASAPMLFRRSLLEIGAHEGSIWIAIPAIGQLVTCYNTQETGWPVAQTLESGLVSKAYKEERPIHQKGLHRYHESSGAVDAYLEQKTQHQISVPFYICGKLVGVLSVVQLSSDFHSEPREDVPWGFDDDAAILVAATATVLGEGIEAHWKRLQQPQ